MASKRRKQPSNALKIPARALAIALKLEQIPGVVCVVWGRRKTGKRWYREPCLSVHVVRKRIPRSLGERIPKQIDGFRIDVLEVGLPKVHSLDVNNLVRAPGVGRSTLTAVAVSAADAIALASGHGTDGASSVTLNDGATTFTGNVGDGGFGGGSAVDWRAITFPGNGGDAETRHPSARANTPVLWSRSTNTGDALNQFSVLRQQRVNGVLQGVVAGQVTISGQVYTQLLSITTSDGAPPFSVDGDSGSLVVNGRREAVAALVGGNPAKSVFYAYDVQRLSGAMSSAQFDLFFR